MKTYLYRTNLLRARWMPNFALAVAGSLIVLLSISFSSNNFADSVIELFNTSKSNVASLMLVTLCLFPALPLSLTYAQDHETRFLYFWTLRGGLRRSIRRHFQIAVLLGALVSGLSDLLFVGILLLRGIPLTSPGVPPSGGIFPEPLAQGNIPLFFAVSILFSMLSAAIAAGWAALAAAAFCHPLSALAAPLVIYILWLRLVPDSAPFYLRIYYIFSGYPTEEYALSVRMLIKFATTLLLCGVNQLLTVWIAERRQRNA